LNCEYKFMKEQLKCTFGFLLRVSIVGAKPIFCLKFDLTSRAGRENDLEAHNGGGQIRRKAAVLSFRLFSLRHHKSWAEFSACRQHAWPKLSKAKINRQKRSYVHQSIEASPAI
jgi:hypothetical protein